MRGNRAACKEQLSSRAFLGRRGGQAGCREGTGTGTGDPWHCLCSAFSSPGRSKVRALHRDILNPLQAEETIHPRPASPSAELCALSAGALHVPRSGRLQDRLSWDFTPGTSSEWHSCPGAPAWHSPGASLVLVLVLLLNSRLCTSPSLPPSFTALLNSCITPWLN